ncbi:MAG: 30S ribosome-binding factor RbfA [Desulfobulbaceae bacterium]|nr:30S ribosome-binding factor RbfA [Desulfobulbaceae bacterium]HIJ77707.1 30S ribosome-binding factor RbfA [Deltaproteobacteria bacterium]
MVAHSKSKFVMPGLGPGPKRRPIRVADMIKAEMATLLLRKIKDPRVSQVVITRVQVSDDLRHAQVYYTMLGDGNIKDAAQGLESTKGFIRSSLARVLEMKYVPALQFKYDLAGERQSEMDQIFREIAEDNGSSS